MNNSTTEEVRYATFNTSSTGYVLDGACEESNELLKYNGTRVRVIRPLTREEADIDDVGNMYEVEFEDGLVSDAFADELTFE